MSERTAGRRRTAMSWTNGVDQMVDRSRLVIARNSFIPRWSYWAKDFALGKGQAELLTVGGKFPMFYPKFAPANLKQNAHKVPGSTPHGFGYSPNAGFPKSRS